MPYPAIVIANAIAKKAIDEGKPITQMKLQKMVYFAHGYTLAKYNNPLITEEFQAWKFGPVVPAIYNEYKLYGKYPITNLDYVSSDNICDISFLTPEANDAILYTWKATRDLSAVSLSAWSHKKGSPWEEVYSQYEASIPIANHKIREYFREFLFR